MMSISIERFVENLAGRAAATLSLNDAAKATVKYGLFVLLTNLIGLLSALLAAWLLQAVVPTSAFLVGLIVLRPSAGGAHCTTPFNCNFLGIILVPLVGWAVPRLVEIPGFNPGVYLVVSLAVAAAGIALKAPYFSQHKPKVLGRRKLLKVRALILSVLIAAAAAVLLRFGHTVWALGLSTGLFWQGLMLLPPGLIVVKWYDSLINGMRGSRR